MQYQAREVYERLRPGCEWFTAGLSTIAGCGVRYGSEIHNQDANLMNTNSKSPASVNPIVEIKTTRVLPVACEIFRNFVNVADVVSRREPDPNDPFPPIEGDVYAEARQRYGSRFGWAFYRRTMELRDALKNPAFEGVAQGDLTDAFATLEIVHEHDYEMEALKPAEIKPEAVFAEIEKRRAAESADRS